MTHGNGHFQKLSGTATARRREKREREVQALVAAGVPELDALTRAGFKDSAQELFRRRMAEVHRAAWDGSPDDLRAACCALLKVANPRVLEGGR